MDENNLGERLRRVRKERNLTLKDVAKTLKISFDYVSRIEKGEREPSEIVKSAIDEFFLSGTTTTTPTAEPLPPASPIIAVINSELERMDEDQHRQVLRVCLDINGEQYALAKHNSHANRENRIKGGGGVIDTKTLQAHCRAA